MSAWLPYSWQLAAASPHRPQCGPSVRGGSLPTSRPPSLPPQPFPMCPPVPLAFRQWPSFYPVPRVLQSSTPRLRSPQSGHLRSICPPSPDLTPPSLLSIPFFLRSRSLPVPRPPFLSPTLIPSLFPVPQLCEAHSGKPHSRERALFNLGQGGWDLGVVFPRGLALRSADVVGRSGSRKN